MHTRHCDGQSLNTEPTLGTVSGTRGTVMDKGVVLEPGRTHSLELIAGLFPSPHSATLPW